MIMNIQIIQIQKCTCIHSKVLQVEIKMLLVLQIPYVAKYLTYMEWKMCLFDTFYVIIL